MTRAASDWPGVTARACPGATWITGPAGAAGAAAGAGGGGGTGTGTGAGAPGAEVTLLDIPSLSSRARAACSPRGPPAPGLGACHGHPDCLVFARRAARPLSRARPGGQVALRGCR